MKSLGVFFLFLSLTLPLTIFGFSQIAFSTETLQGYVAVVSQSYQPDWNKCRENLEKKLSAGEQEKYQCIVQVSPRQKYDKAMEFTNEITTINAFGKNYNVAFIGAFHSYTIILQKNDLADKNIGCDSNQAISIMENGWAKVGIKEFNASIQRVMPLPKNE